MTVRPMNAKTFGQLGVFFFMRAFNFGRSPASRPKSNPQRSCSLSVEASPAGESETIVIRRNDELIGIRGPLGTLATHATRDRGLELLRALRADHQSRAVLGLHQDTLVATDIERPPAESESHTVTAVVEERAVSRRFGL